MSKFTPGGKPDAAEEEKPSEKGSERVQAKPPGMLIDTPIFFKSQSIWRIKEKNQSEC